MNEFAAWMQSNWYSLGNLVSQFAFLGAGLWFARRILKTMKTSQEQTGALLRQLWVTGNQRNSASAAGERSFANASPYWLTPTEIPAASPLQLPESGPSRWTVAWHSLVVWLKTPMRSGNATLWRRTARWLQSPAGS